MYSLKILYNKIYKKKFLYFLKNKNLKTFFQIKKKYKFIIKSEQVILMKKKVSHY